MVHHKPKQKLPLCAGLISACILSASATAAIACEPLGWNRFLDPGPQTYEVTEEIDLGGDRYVTGVKFDRLKGPYAKKYLFALFDGDCTVAIVSLGRYAMTALMSDEPEYHLDLYQSETHATLDFYKRPPRYQKIRRIALDVFKKLGQP